MVSQHSQDFNCSWERKYNLPHCQDLKANLIGMGLEGHFTHKQLQVFGASDHET